MAEKYLSELEWKSTAKKHGLKDGPLSKALGALESGKTPDVQLKALDEVDKQLKDLRKGAAGNKELSVWLDGLEKSAERQRKESEFEAKRATRSSGEGEEEDAPDLLTAKMKPLVRKVAGGDVAQVLVASTGKKVAVLMSLKPISKSRRKLLTDYLDGGTPKFFEGTCVFEEEFKSHTFVLETLVAGLAKLIKVALQEQVELRVKVRVRGVNPDDGADDDGEPPEVEGQEQETEELKGEAIPEAPPLKEGVSVDPLKAEFETRWPGVEAQVLDLLRRNVGDTSKLRAVAEFVREKADAANYKAALQGMDSLWKLIGAATAPPAPPLPTAKPEARPEAPQSDETVAFNKRLAAVLPKIKEAMAADVSTTRAPDAKLKASEAGVAARKKDFETAYRLLDEAEEMADWIIKHPVEPGGGEEDEQQTEEEDAKPKIDTEGAARFEKRLAEIEPDYLALLAARNPEAGRLRGVLAYANGQAEEGEYTKALGALDRLKGMMDEARGKGGGSGEPPAGIVAYRSSLLGLRQAVATVERQIASLAAAIPTANPDEAELADDLAEALRSENAELQDLVDEAMSAAGDKAQPATRELRSRLELLIDALKSNELIKHVDSNAFGVQLSVGKTLGDALAKVRDTMPEVA